MTILWTRSKPKFSFLLSLVNNNITSNFFLSKTTRGSSKISYNHNFAELLPEFLTKCLPCFLKANDHKKTFWEVIFGKKVKKSFHFVQSIWQFSMIKTSFFSEKLGVVLTNRRGLVMKRKFFFLFCKKQQRQKFQQKKK